MSRVFLHLLNQSLTASVLILAVIGLRFLFRKLPKSPQCLLWAAGGALLSGKRLEPDPQGGAHSGGGGFLRPGTGEGKGLPAWGSNSCCGGNACHPNRSHG